MKKDERRDRYRALEQKYSDRIRQGMSAGPYLGLLGMEVEEVRQGYARMRLLYRPELNQPNKIVHGGAIASLLDTVVVPAILSVYGPLRRMVTTDMHIHYMSAAVEHDVIAEGWIRKQGRTTAFLAAEAMTPDGEVVAHGELCYRVVPIDRELRAANAQ